MHEFIFNLLENNQLKGVLLLCFEFQVVISYPTQMHCATGRSLIKNPIKPDKIR